MSLSFVSKAIQTTAADGTYEEQAVVENADEKNRGANNTRVGNGLRLFDQLRQNKEEEEASQLEFQLSIMRGTLALDEDDAAHLQELQKQREIEIAEQERLTQSELMSFRAAQAERIETKTTVVDGITPNSTSINHVIDASILSQSIVDDSKKPFVPLIKIKKRKRQVEQADMKVIDPTNFPNNNTNDMKGKKESTLLNSDKSNLKTTIHHVDERDVDNRTEVVDGTLASLLSGYSSDES